MSNKPPMDFRPANYERFLREQPWRDTIPTDNGAFARLIRHIEQYPRCVSDACGQNADRCPTPELCHLVAPAPAEAATEIDSTPRPKFLRREGAGVYFWPVVSAVAVVCLALLAHAAARLFS